MGIRYEHCFFASARPKPGAEYPKPEQKEEDAKAILEIITNRHSEDSNMLGVISLFWDSVFIRSSFYERHVFCLTGFEDPEQALHGILEPYQTCTGGFLSYEILSSERRYALFPIEAQNIDSEPITTSLIGKRRGPTFKVTDKRVQRYMKTSGWTLEGNMIEMQTEDEKDTFEKFISETKIETIRIEENSIERYDIETVERENFLSMVDEADGGKNEIFTILYNIRKMMGKRNQAMDSFKMMLNYPERSLGKQILKTFKDVPLLCSEWNLFLDADRVRLKQTKHSTHMFEFSVEQLGNKWKETSFENHMKTLISHLKEYETHCREEGMVFLFDLRDSHSVRWFSDREQEKIEESVRWRVLQSKLEFCGDQKPEFRQILEEFDSIDHITRYEETLVTEKIIEIVRRENKLGHQSIVDEEDMKKFHRSSQVSTMFLSSAYLETSFFREIFESSESMNKKLMLVLENAGAVISLRGIEEGEDNSLIRILASTGRFLSEIKKIGYNSVGIPEEERAKYWESKLEALAETWRKGLEEGRPEWEERENLRKEKQEREKQERLENEKLEESERERQKQMEERKKREELEKERKEKLEREKQARKAERRKQKEALKEGRLAEEIEGDLSGHLFKLIGIELEKSKIRRRKLEKLLDELDIRVKFIASDSGVKVNGQRRFQQRAEDVILKYGSKFLLEIKRKKEIKAVYEKVRWEKVDTSKNKWVSFNSKDNYQIETAYSRKQEKMKIGDLQEFEFARMNDQHSPLRRRLVVRDESLGHDSKLPKNWDPAPSQQKLVQVTLERDSEEFKDVERDFLDKYDVTVMSPAVSDIIEIKRLQNPRLYKAYESMRQAAAAANNEVPYDDNVESNLWHGTSVETVPFISSGGFNRSFCGRNASVFGRGVCFAVRSSYAGQDLYSRPDGTGNKHLYRTKVITGRYAQGEKEYETTPEVPGHAPLRYDSVVDNINKPDIFVIFHDAVAYPEYLITFRNG